MSNEELIRRFENDAHHEDSFHHGGHVRLAFAYLCEYPVLEALQRFSNALKRFDSARGNTQLYHGDHHLRIFLSDPREDGAVRRRGMG
jgi:hypothetical protein